MGIYLSTTATSPFFLTSGIIGFISFAFTLGTFLRVLWTNFETLGEAPHEVHAYLTNLRTEILEERASLRAMRKLCKKHHRLVSLAGGVGRVDSGVELDEVTLRTMGDVVKQLLRKFKELERPFLEDGEWGVAGVEGREERRRRRRRREERSMSPSWNEKGGGGDRSRSRTEHERGGRRLSRYGMERYEDDDQDDPDGERFWAQRVRYADYGFGRRLRWLYKKPQAQQLFETLSRVQLRRMARQVGGLSVLVHEYGGSTLHVQEAVRRIDERVARVVGVRRVDEG
ncbi:hypothetical protein B0A50_00801 [Salinomyces thailandicus]|uniref:Uncharacterized protein n=1 Tax=Salinomyces thailandicus TaxID=706561 RepID=A0A4U0UCR8_9PEZI|nr:hypothetical protein B0A50_00801 [Salinomyces thailandica]